MSLIIASINKFSASDKKHINVTCATGQLTKTCHCSHVSHIQTRLSGASQTHGDSAASGAFFEVKLKVYPCLQPMTSVFVSKFMCVTPWASFCRSRPKLSARKGPQEQAMCACVQGAHMSDRTCMCVCVRGPASPPTNVVDYIPHVITRDRKWCRAPEGECLPRKSPNSLLQWNPGLHHTRTN